MSNCIEILEPGITVIVDDFGFNMEAFLADHALYANGKPDFDSEVISKEGYRVNPVIFYYHLATYEDFVVDDPDDKFWNGKRVLWFDLGAQRDNPTSWRGLQCMLWQIAQYMIEPETGTQWGRWEVPLTVRDTDAPTDWGKVTFVVCNDSDYVGVRKGWPEGHEV